MCLCVCVSFWPLALPVIEQVLLSVLPSLVCEGSVLTGLSSAVRMMPGRVAAKGMHREFKEPARAYSGPFGVL